MLPFARKYAEKMLIFHSLLGDMTDFRLNAAFLIIQFSKYQYMERAHSIIHDICAKPLPERTMQKLFFVSFEIGSTQNSNTYKSDITLYQHTHTRKHTCSIQCSIGNRNNRIILKNSVDSFVAYVVHFTLIQVPIRWE